MATSGMFPRSSISGGSDEVHERVCSLCSKEGRVVDAIELCLDCEQYLCRPCSAHHGRFKALQAHNVVKKDQVPNLSLSVLTGSETIDFECTVCTVNGRYRAARVYCENCRKYLCSLCEKDHNLFALTRKHNMKSVEEIKKDVNKNLGKDNQYFAIEEKTVSAAKFSCVSCKREIDDVKRMWKCINCGFSNRCRGCCDQHQSSDKDHRIIPFHEFKVIYEQYGKAVMSGSGEFMGPVCSKCSMNGLAMYPSMFCLECKIFVCKLCQEEHNSHRTEKDDPVKRMHTDEIQQMTNIDHDCNVCMDINLRSSAEGYCTSCDVFICNGCIKLHTIYFGRESHIIQGLREINVRKKVFFDKTLYGAVEIGNLPCSFCRKKRIDSFAMCSCSDCKKDLCILCLDFHEIANVEHNLKFLRIHGEKEDSCEETELDQLQPKPRQAVEFNPIPSKLLLAAIDFGSLRSGYTSIVYSLSRTLKEGKFNKMHIIQIEETCVSENSKSCLLFDADQRLSYFGEEAMTKYKEFQIKGEADRWYFFEQYDKCLLDTKVSYKTKLFSANGKSMRAGNVFEALMIHLITTMLIRVPELFQASDIQLVCLVADEVSETCQSMLQNAAAKAGLDKKFVTSVSKATCIIKYCDLYDLPESKLEGKFPENFWKTEKLFLVAALGYDQNEVSVHKRLEDGTCREIDRRYLGEWGFRKCVSECKEIFPEIFGHDVYNEFCDRDPDWLCELTKKVSSFLLSHICESSTQKITFSLPVDLITLYEERTNTIFKEEVGKLPEHLRATTFHDKLRIDKSYFESVVASCIANNISLIKTVLTKHRFSKISTVIFFGTLLENQDIKEAMLGNFDGVVIDSDGGHTSSKAAVLYEFLKIRIICRFTYGINVCHDFYNEIHTKDHRLRMASRSISHEIEIIKPRSDFCHNLFRRYFVRGEIINVGQIRYSRYTTIFPYQRKMVMFLLRSERREPKYADENGIEEFDVISVDLGRDVMHGQVEVRMVFTETYLLVEGFLVQKRNDDTKGTLKKVYAKKFPIIS